MDPTMLFVFFMVTKGVLLVGMAAIAVSALRRFEVLEAEKRARAAAAATAEPEPEALPADVPFRRAA